MLQHGKPQAKKTPPKVKATASKNDQTGMSKQSHREEQAAPAISSQQRQNMIKEAAYYIAQRRDFIGGNPVDDWLMAESEVDKQLSTSRR